MGAGNLRAEFAQYFKGKRDYKERGKKSGEANGKRMEPLWAIARDLEKRSTFFGAMDDRGRLI